VTAIEVDARGLRCPLPVIRLAAAALNAAGGTRIIVLATDPAARHDIPAWCRMRDHELHEVTEVTEAPLTDARPSADPTYLRFEVVLGPHPSKASGAGTSRAR